MHLPDTRSGMPPVFTEFLYRVTPVGNSEGSFNVVIIAINTAVAHLKLEQEYPDHYFRLINHNYCEACE